MKTAVLLILSATAVIAANDDGSHDPPCLTSQHECRDHVGLSALFVFNGDYYCCTAGHTMQWRNTNNCTCHATHQVETCHAGQQACVNAATFILDGEGNIHCCPPGSSSIQAFHTNLNGRQVDSCTCSFQVSPDDDIPEAANSVVFTNTQVAGEGANVTHIGQEARHAGQALLDDMRALRDNLARAFNNLPGLRHHQDDNNDDDDDDDDGDDDHDDDHHNGDNCDSC